MTPALPLGGRPAGDDRLEVVVEGEDEPGSPPGSGFRLDDDRDADDHHDSDELLHGSDPADPNDPL